MKKNKFFIAGLVTVFVAIVTLTLVSTTFAKYTSTGNGTATARVAKWGVTLSTGTMDGFAESYDTKDETIKATFEKSVVATVNVMAPGTNGTFGKASLSGTPEVAVRVSYNAVLTLTGWIVDGNNYCPLTFTVGTTTINADGDMTMDELKKAVEKAVNALSAEYAAGTDLSTIGAGVTISWKWEFSTNEANDLKDTALGNLPTAPTVEFKLTTTVEQID